LVLTSSSAYSVTSGDIFFGARNIEGFNVADLGWGTANAQTITLSFWVEVSLTGTFGGALRNSAGDRVIHLHTQFLLLILGNIKHNYCWRHKQEHGSQLMALVRLVLGLVLAQHTVELLELGWFKFLVSHRRNISVVGTKELRSTSQAYSLKKAQQQRHLITDHTPLSWQLCQGIFQIYGGQGGTPNFQTMGGDMNTVYPLPVEMRVTNPTGTKSGTWAKSNCDLGPYYGSCLDTTAIPQSGLPLLTLGNV
jgi:hypothetical protein